MSNQSLFEKVATRVKENNKRLYATVGQPAPFTSTTINDAETAVGFTSIEIRPGFKPKKRAAK